MAATEDEDEEELRMQIEMLEEEEIKLDAQLSAASHHDVTLDAVTLGNNCDLSVTPGKSCDLAETTGGQNTDPSSTPTGRKTRNAQSLSSAPSKQKDAYISQLHAYNEIKDATQAVLGMLATHERVTVKELHLKYLPDVKHV